jgi:hypothetical protein
MRNKFIQDIYGFMEGSRKVDLSIIFDVISGAVVTQTLEHSKIHQGKGFQFIGDTTLSGTTPAYRLFKTGEQVLHFKYRKVFTEKANTFIELYEAPTVTAEGTQQNGKIAFNREKSQVCDMKVFTGPTIAADGILLDIDPVFGEVGTGQTNSGDTNEDDSWEFILKPNTYYLIKGYRLAGSTGDSRTVVKYRWYIGGKL